MLSVPSFLKYAFFVCAFRVFMYTFNKEFVAKIKVTPQSWADPQVREVMEAYVAVVRTDMLFRGVYYFWAAFFLSEETVTGNIQAQFASISLFFELYTLIYVIKMFLSPSNFNSSSLNKNKVMIHQQGGVAPFCIQLSVVLVGCISLYGHFYQ